MASTPARIVIEHERLGDVSHFTTIEEAQDTLIARGDDCTQPTLLRLRVRGDEVLDEDGIVVGYALTGIPLDVFTKEIRKLDAELAPESETTLWGDYLTSMGNVTGVYPLWDELTPFTAVSFGEVAWWREAYRRFGEIGQYADVQEYYDSIGTVEAVAEEVRRSEL